MPTDRYYPNRCTDDFVALVAAALSKTPPLHKETSLAFQHEINARNAVDAAEAVLYELISRAEQRQQEDE
jgi:hypothetical protein